jgi:hypothetical protein
MKLLADTKGLAVAGAAAVTLGPDAAPVPSVIFVPPNAAIAVWLTMRDWIGIARR